MTHSRLIRRALASVFVTAAATTAVALASTPANAQSRPGITVTHYQLTPTESWNVCGGSAAIIHFYDDSATMTVNCGTGDVTIYS